MPGAFHCLKASKLIEQKHRNTYLRVDNLFGKGRLKNGRRHWDRNLGPRLLEGLIMHVIPAILETWLVCCGPHYILKFLSFPLKIGDPTKKMIILSVEIVLADAGLNALLENQVLVLHLHHDLDQEVQKLRL